MNKNFNNPIVIVCFALFLLLTINVFNDFTGLATGSNNQTGIVSYDLEYAITNWTSSDLTSSSININATANAPSNFTIYYDTDNKTTYSNNSNRAHNITLSSLDSLTFYNFTIFGNSSIGNQTLGPFNFTTLIGTPDLDEPRFNFLRFEISNGSDYIDSNYNLSINFTDDDIIDSFTFELDSVISNLSHTSGFAQYEFSNFNPNSYFLRFNVSDRTGNNNSINYTYTILKNSSVEISTNISTASIFTNESKFFEILSSSYDNLTNIKLYNESELLMDLGNYSNQIIIDLNASDSNYYSNQSNDVFLTLTEGNFYLLITSLEDDYYFLNTKRFPINLFGITKTLVEIEEGLVVEFNSSSLSVPLTFRGVSFEE